MLKPSGEAHLLVDGYSALQPLPPNLVQHSSSGDDDHFESANAYNPDDWAATIDLLDTGTLYVATFFEGGK